MNYGDIIKDLRLKKGMTLEELGEKVGVGKSTVRKWETGAIANMRRDKIAKLADALGVSPSTFIIPSLTDDTSKPADIPDGLSEEETAMLDLFSRLSPGARENTLQALRILGSLQEADQRAVSDLVLAVLQTKGLL